MAHYHITSAAGLDLGIFEGADATAAYLAFLRDANVPVRAAASGGLEYMEYQPPEDDRGHVWVPVAPEPGMVIEEVEASEREEV